ncbi:MAG: sodium ion-translocating decarboxylase subunit beta, partial [Bacteroidales bacterium]|nr:sodium ion-translocating decarboxylase subunit beta [Bacteroidales bacterium]
MKRVKCLILAFAAALGVSAFAQDSNEGFVLIVEESAVIEAPAVEEAAEADLEIGSSIEEFVSSMGIVKLFQGDGWKNLVMIAIGCLLLYLAIVKKYEPLLLLPIAFGMILTNLPGAGLYNANLFADGHVHWA